MQLCWTGLKPRPYHQDKKSHIWTIYSICCNKHGFTVNFYVYLKGQKECKNEHSEVYSQVKIEIFKWFDAIFTIVKKNKRIDFSFFFQLLICFLLSRFSLYNHSLVNPLVQYQIPTKLHFSSYHAPLKVMKLQ